MTETIQLPRRLRATNDPTLTLAQLAHATAADITDPLTGSTTWRQAAPMLTVEEAAHEIGVLPEDLERMWPGRGPLGDHLEPQLVETFRYLAGQARDEATRKTTTETEHLASLPTTQALHLDHIEEVA